MTLRDHWYNFWLATDYYVSSLIWHDQDITISSQTAKARDAGKQWGCWGCKALNVMFRTSDHCGGALVHDGERAAQAEQILNPVQQDIERYNKDHPNG